MKISQRFRKYFKKRIKFIGAILNEPEKATLKDIHKLRVSIKKLRAIIALINFSSKKFKKKKYLKPYKKIFKQGGKVRNLQIEESILRRIEAQEKLKNYLSELRESLNQENQNWISLASNNKSKKLKSYFNDLTPYFNNINRKSIRRFNKHVSKYILKFMKPKRWKKKHLHRFRKKIKVLFYIIKVSPLESKKLKKGIGYMQKLIGDWHDYVMIIEHIQEVINAESISLSEKENLKSVKWELELKVKKIYLHIENQKGKLRQLVEQA